MTRGNEIEPVAGLPTEEPLGDDGLYRAAVEVVEESRRAVAPVANSITVTSNWRLGYLIDTEIRIGAALPGNHPLLTLAPQPSRHGRRHPTVATMDYRSLWGPPPVPRPRS
jgi:hypothetical protein